jgi:hypothetical protein
VALIPPFRTLIRSFHEIRYIEDIIKRTDAPRVRCNEYLNALVHAKEVVKLSKKGQLYKMDPVKYPLTEKF